jgi:hypothetical protein
MRNNEAFALGTIGLIALVMFGKVRAASTLLILPGSVSALAYENGSPVIDLSLIVQNTSTLGFTIESLAGQVFFNNTYVGNVSNFVPVHVAGNSQTVVPVRLKLFILGAVNEITKAIIYKNAERVIQLRGYVNAGLFRAPVEVSFTIGKR